MRGKPAAMAGFWGSHMGLIDLLLEHDGGGWRVAAFEASARPIYQRNEDRSVTALVGDYAPPIEATAAVHAGDARLRAGRGRADRRRRCSPTSRVVADDPSVQIVSQAQTWYVTELLKGTEWEGLPVLSAAAPFKSGGRGGPDYYTDVAGRADRDQERGRRLPLPEHAAGGGDHRRAGRRTGWSGRPASSCRSSRARPTSR